MRESTLALSDHLDRPRTATRSVLQLSPPAIKFTGVEPTGQCYVANFAVKNTSDRALKFRIIPPTRASSFHLLSRSGEDLAHTSNPTVKLPPGLSIRYDVTFKTEDLDMAPLVLDALQVKGEDGSYLEVPLMARRACPIVEVESRLCDFGLVVLGQRAAQVVKLRNVGSRTGHIEIEVLDGGNDSTAKVSGNNNSGNHTACVTVSPTEAILTPNDAVTMKIDVTGKEVGNFRTILRIRIHETVDSKADEDDDHVQAQSTVVGKAYAENIVDISGKIVEHTVELVLKNSDEPIRSLFFGSLFAGESKVIETLLRNNGPQPLHFKTSLTFVGSGAAHGSHSNGKNAGSGEHSVGDEDREAYERRKELQVFPSEGKVEPFADLLITFSYRPHAVDIHTLQEMDYKRRVTEARENSSGSNNNLPSDSVFLNAFASIHCTEIQAQNLTVEVTGKKFLPWLEITPSSTLDFGDVKTHDRADMLLSLKNVSGLPVHFAISKVAHFSTKPSSGRLDVLQSLSLIVSFTPTQLGSFRNTLELTINRDILVVPIQVKGNAAAVGDVKSKPLIGGIQALPSDFVPKYKFVLADEAKNSKGTLTHRFHRMPAYEVAALNGTAAIDEYEFQGTNNTHLTYCVKELAKRAEHNASYHDYLADCWHQRKEKAKRKSATEIKKNVSVARNISEKERATDDNNDDINLGMERQSGVEPRMLRLSPDIVRKSDPLWLKETSGTSGNHANVKVLFDENKFVKKKYKPHPSTQAEMADCGKTLNFDELEQVISGPKTLNFGKLSVNGVAKRSLSIQNNLAHNVLISLHLNEMTKDLEELASMTVLKSQVVPPRSLAGFDVYFTSKKEQFFQRQLTFSINGVHTRQVMIVAEVTPIVVELSADELQFEFSYLNLNPSMSLEVTLSNSSDSVAPFSWSAVASSTTLVRPDSSKSNDTVKTSSDKTMSAVNPTVGPSVFEIVPASGTLGPAATAVCQVVFTPPASGFNASQFCQQTQDRDSGGAWLSSIFQLDVVGGRKAFLKCKGLVQDVKVSVKDKKVDFGTISVGMEKEKRLAIMNTSNDSTTSSQRLVFYASVEPASIANSLGVSLAPLTGTILSQETCEICVKIVPHKAVTLDNNSLIVNVQIRGGKSIKIPIVATVLVPDVHVTLANAVDFGDVIIGVSVPRVISLENHSTIPACLIADLSSTLTDEFTIATPSKLLARFEDVGSIFLPIMDRKSVPSTGSGHLNSSSPSVCDTTIDSDLDSICSKWQICIPPNSKVAFHLVFTPKRPGKHDHMMPIQFAGVSSGTGIGRPESITRRVIATAVPPRVLFSAAALNFHRCVITREGIRKVPYTKTLVLTNNDTKSVKWSIDTNQLKQAAQFANPASTVKRVGATSASAASVIFHIAPDKGELAPNEEVKLRVSFLPLEAVEYVEEEIPLFVDDQFYIHFSVRGEGIYPHLSFSENKVILPTVPLGIPSIARVFVQSTGYDHLEVNYRVPLDTAKAPVTLHFPKGKILSMACPKVPVEIRFCSKKSVAFNARIEFFDADGNAFHLPIAGCAENCVLTNFTFLEGSGVDRKIIDDALDPATIGISGVLREESEANGNGNDKLKRANYQSAAISNIGYYTHISGRFPIYLLHNKQIETELTKHTQDQTGNPQQQHQPYEQNGFVDVDPTLFSGEDTGLTSTTTHMLHLVPGISSQADLSHHHQPSQFSESEIQFLVQYLNANFLRNPVKKFPQDFADALGKPLYELLDMVCLKKPPGGTAMPGLTISGKANKNAVLPTKKDLLVHYTSQYTELLKFLKSYGAMIHDVYPEHLLSQEFYVRACEDPCVDPAVLSSLTLSSMKFLQRRHVLENEWEQISATAWMKVLYQVVKCFLLYRITWKGYQQQQSQLHSGSGGLVFNPRFCQGSNVYSEAEMVMIQWICDCVRSQLYLSGYAKEISGLEAQLVDIKRDLGDGSFLFYLIAAHIPIISPEQNEYRCFQLDYGKSASLKQKRLPPAQLRHNTIVLLQTLGSFGIDFGIDPTVFLQRMNSREMVILLLHMNQMLPQFIPKATIEFKGALGQVMEKSIELKNPSPRALRYQVFLDGESNHGTAGNSAFTIESNHVVLEPGKTVPFMVSFCPRFSRKVSARLVFQSVREIPPSSAASGATMVFLLESNVVSRKPVRIIQIEANTYEKKIEELVIENQFPAPGSYKVSMTQIYQQQSNTLQDTVSASSSSLQKSTTTMGGPGKRRRKSVQTREIIAAVSTVSSSQPQSSTTGPRRSSQVGKSRDEVDCSWCMAAQQPFFLSEFGMSGSNTGDFYSSDSEASSSNGNPVISIRNLGTATVKLEFLPLVPGKYRCQLLFLDEKVGEFMYEIHATAHLPASLETLELQCETTITAGGGTAGVKANRFHFVRELVVPVKNPSLTRALANFVERCNGVLKTKVKDGLKKCEEGHHKAFQIEFNSPYFTTVHPELMLSNAASSTKISVSNAGENPSLSAASSEGSNRELSVLNTSGKSALKPTQARLSTPRAGNLNSAMPNSVLIDFQPKGAGVYTCKLLLRSHHTVCGSSDVRVYDLVAKVKEPSVKTLLEFVAPARHTIVQEIPLSNPSDTLWILKAVFEMGTSTHASMFTGPTTLQIPPKKTVSYPLTFAPKWITTEKCSFMLVNPSTQQQFEFELNGFGEEPLAQDHVVLSCQARTSVVHEFDVMSFKTDPLGVQSYKVESDLRDVVGDPMVTIMHAGGHVKYPLTFSPRVSGTYFGSITFTNLATKEYIWYTIEANVGPPEAEATLEMCTMVRGAIGVEISLANPLDHAVTFVIELRGEGLQGPETFSLEAKESGVYELAFIPLLVTSKSGEQIHNEGAILFSNDDIGQFWYRLLLTAEPCPPVELTDMCCAVGDVCSEPIWLQNPTDRELLLQYKVTNPRNFSIKGGVESRHPNSSQRIVIPPYGQASVVLEYTPSSLSDLETTSVVFFEPGVVSDWEFVVKGRGKAPSVMKPIIVHAKVNEAASTLFTFKNPFADVLRVDVKLVIIPHDDDNRTRMKLRNEDTSNVFTILLKKSRVQLESFGHLQVPISFTPQYVSAAHAEIIISGADAYSELEWRYPIEGIAEAPLHPRPFVLACHARESVEKTINCELLASPPDIIIANEVLTAEWEIPAERFGVLACAAAIERSLTVTPLTVPASASSPNTVQYQIRFDPLRPYRGSIYLLIKKQSGGQWRFEVVLDVSDPPIDDVLAIEASLNQTSSISFQLRNQFRIDAPFVADFSPGSSNAFTVYPTEGVLPPYGSVEGVSFVVSFTPTGYGKMQSGQLLITTEEMQWTFNIKGTYPDATVSGSSSLSSTASRNRLGISGTTSNRNKYRGKK